MGMAVNQTQLAEAIGYSDVSIWEWQQQPDFPILKRGERGTENQYDLAAVVRWLLDRARASNPKERLALEKMELEVRELRAKEALRENRLVPREEVEPTWYTRVLTAAAFMLSRRSRLAGMLEATAGLEAKRDILKREDAAFLTKLGVEGERMQAELEAMLARLSETEASEFLRRIAGDDPSSPEGDS